MMGAESLVYPTALPFNGFMMDNQMLGWNVPPEHSDLVHPHWRGFKAPDMTWHVGLAILYAVIMVVSVVGNGVVLYIFAKVKGLRTASNLFIVNQAVFDLFMMVEMPMFVASSMYQRPVGWETGCAIYAYVGAVSGMGSAINNAVIAFDRFKTISSPLDGRLSFKHAVVLVIFTWLWTMPFSILPLLETWGRYIPEGFLTTCSFDFLTESFDIKMFVASIFTWAYVIPLCIIVLCYSQLFKHVRAHEKMLAEQAKKMNVKSLVSNQEQKSVEIRIAKVAFTIFFMFLCSWTPYAVVAMVGAFGNRRALTPYAAMIPAMACKIVSCIDPWVYAINHPRFREEINRRLGWFGGPQNDSASSDVVSSATIKADSESQA